MRGRSTCRLFDTRRSQPPAALVARRLFREEVGGFGKERRSWVCHCDRRIVLITRDRESSRPIRLGYVVDEGGHCPHRRHYASSRQSCTMLNLPKGMRGAEMNIAVRLAPATGLVCPGIGKIDKFTERKLAPPCRRSRRHYGGRSRADRAPARVGFRDAGDSQPRSFSTVARDARELPSRLPADSGLGEPRESMFVRRVGWVVYGHGLPVSCTMLGCM